MGPKATRQWERVGRKLEKWATGKATPGLIRWGPITAPFNRAIPILQGTKGTRPRLPEDFLHRCCEFVFGRSLREQQREEVILAEISDGIDRLARQGRCLGPAGEDSFRRGEDKPKTRAAWAVHVKFLVCKGFRG